MSNGFDEARGQRNALERLGARIPGFRGFQDRELRRDVDRLQREHMAAELGRIKAAARRSAGDYTDAGKIGVLAGFERLDKRLDGLSQGVRFADYGASGLFDPVKIGQPELERLYEFDLGLLADLDALESAVGAIPPPGGDDPRAAIDEALAAADRVRDKWASRERVIGNIVHTMS